jgi:uncharacterized protein YecE (DUF72 family)
MRWRIGTMGFSYSAWAGGVFYPPGVKPGDYLAYFARCFDCVELDTTFYAAPDRDRVRRWAAAVGEDFRFSVKTPRDITHADDVGATAGAFLAFAGVLDEFGEKLGTVLLQFPPSFTARRWQELERLLRCVPPAVPLCAEFRHESWWQWEETPRFLADYSVTWASADYVASPRELRTVGGKAYVRLIGEHDRYPSMNREERDPESDLIWWRGQLEQTPLDEAWVLLNNDYAGFSIATAERLKRMLGMAADRPLAARPGLFG